MMDEKTGERLKGLLVTTTLIIFILLSQLIVSKVYCNNNEITIIKNNFINGYNSTHQKRYREAVEFLGKVKEVEQPARDYVLFYLGKSRLGMNDCREGKRILRELIHRYPRSRFVEEAKPLLVLSPCAAELSKISEPPCEALSRRRQADCYFEKRDYQKSRDLYRELATSRFSPSLTIAFLKRLSQSAARIQDFAGAIAANWELIKKFSMHREVIEALERIAFLHQDSGNFNEAIPIYAILLPKIKKSQERDEIREKIGWCFYRLGQYPAAIKIWEEMEEETAASFFWQARSWERRGNLKRTRELDEQVVEKWPQSYYALRALSRLSGSKRRAQMTEGWPDRVKLQWEKEKVHLDYSEEWARIFALRELELPHEAEVEIRRLRAGQRELIPSDLSSLSFEIRQTPEDADFRIPYAGILFPEIRKRGLPIDPWLVYAMMRQESHYEPRRRSRAGALGLLQLMPQTAERIARELRWADFQTEWLLEPITNIELSLAYLKKLSRLFDDWYEMVAAYSAGEGTVAEWRRQRRGLSEEEFIEEIPYEETRQYVKKVYTYWQAYRWIYD